MGYQCAAVFLQSEESVVTCSDETRHNFQSGDYVTFSEVQVGRCLSFLCYCLCLCVWSRLMSTVKEKAIVTGHTTIKKLIYMYSSPSIHPSSPP